MTYADKCDRFGYSLYRFYRDIRQNNNVNVLIGRLYPNVLDHVVLDDDVDPELITQVTHSPLVDDAAASIQRFASRCLAADKSEWLKSAMSQVLMHSESLSKPIIDVLLFYGAELDHNDGQYLDESCTQGMHDSVQRLILNGHEIDEYHVRVAILSGNCDTVKLTFNACSESVDFEDYDLSIDNATVQLMELILSLNIIQRGTCYLFSNIPSFSVLQWILDHDVMKHDRLLIDIALNASSYSGHYFDMLRYLIEQRNFTVPRDVLAKIRIWRAEDLGVFDYLMLHGADVNAVDRIGNNVLEHSPLVIRYWIDKGLVIKSNDAHTMILSVQHGMTVPVLEMMIDKYELDVNAARTGYTALHEACIYSRYDVVEMLILHGADVNKGNSGSRTPYEVSCSDRIKQLLIQHGYVPM